MIDIIRGASEKPVSTDTLIKHLENASIKEGIFYTGYPIIGEVEGQSAIDGLLISLEHGIIVFDIVEETQQTDRESLRDELYNIMLQRLIGHKELTAKRGQLKANLTVVTFAPAWQKGTNQDEEILIYGSDLSKLLSNEKQYYFEDDDYRKLLQTIQAITKLKHKAPRKVSKENSKGAILNEIEKSISNLDRQQSKAVIETVNGIQRIRGLAGSGKTIVLALKVAYLHSKYSDWTIGVTFNTRSLKNQFIDLIYKFTIDQKNEEPNWENIKILQAWGSSRDTGIYYEFCKANNVEYLDFDTAKNRYGYSSNLIDIISSIAISKVEDSKEIYDAILVDEAQDFSESFLKLCYKLLKPADIHNSKNKRLIYAYDELQKLNDVNPLRNPLEIFEGITFENTPDKPQQDIILKKCYRNSAPVLITAHALGFGIYREQSLVTMFNETNLWKDVGYKVEDGELKIGHHVTLKRDNETSPDFLANKINSDDILKFKSFESFDRQIHEVSKEIVKNLKEDELNYRDIIVIHPNALKAKNDLALLRKLLFKEGIESHLAGVNTSSDDFFLDNSIVFTSIYRAKGNEAAMIYIINADFCFDRPELIKRRNILFTAITRSKAWVRVYGVGKQMEELNKEFAKVKENNFKLSFNYPTIEQMEKLNILHRDLTESDKRLISETEKELKNLLSKLKSKQINLEDLSKQELGQLKKLLDDIE